MAGQLLDGGDVRPCVQEIAHEGAAQVVGGERLGKLRLFGALRQRPVDGLGGEAGPVDPAALVHRQEQAAAAGAADGEPGFEGGHRGSGQGEQPLLAAFGVADGERGGGDGEVGECQTGEFLAP